MEILIPFLLISSVVIAIGFLLFFSSRWAQRHRKLLGKNESAWSWGTGRTEFSYRHFLFGKRSDIEIRVARNLAWMVLIAVSCALLWLTYLILF